MKPRTLEAADSRDIVGLYCALFDLRIGIDAGKSAMAMIAMAKAVDRPFVVRHFCALAKKLKKTLVAEDAAVESSVKSD